MIQALTILWLIVVGILLANLGTVIEALAAGISATTPTTAPAPQLQTTCPPIPKTKQAHKPTKPRITEPARPETGLRVRWLEGRRSRVPGSYYIDEDQCDRRLVRLLRAHGLQVQTTYEAGNGKAKDLVQLKFATTRRMVVITCDKHFRGLHSRGAVHSGIIHCPKGPYWFPEVLRVALRLSMETAEV